MKPIHVQWRVVWRYKDEPTKCGVTFPKAFDEESAKRIARAEYAPREIEFTLVEPYDRDPPIRRTK